MGNYRLRTRVSAIAATTSIVVGVLAGTALANTPVDENLYFSVRLSDTTEASPPVGETAYGYIDTRYPRFTTGDSPMGSMTATLLIDGAPSGQSITPYGTPTLSVGSFGGSDKFKIDVSRPGTYSALITGT